MYIYIYKFLCMGAHKGESDAIPPLKEIVTH